MVLMLLIALLVGSLGGAPVIADVLLIEEVRQAERMELPVNGMNKSEVRARFGEPAETRAAVGDPPISSWGYGRWSVYFEYDLVLFTVLHKGEILDKKTEESR
jgi:hypothetical protein